MKFRTTEYLDKAEQCLSNYNPGARYAMTPVWLSMAQVYATLAQAAATAESGVVIPLRDTVKR